MTISATSAHADLSEGCELQGDYGAVLNGVDGLMKRENTFRMSKTAVAREMVQLSHKANEVYSQCISTQVGHLFENREPVALADVYCAQKEEEAIQAVFTLKRNSTDKEYCFSRELGQRFESVVKSARSIRGISYGHGIERRN